MKLISIQSILNKYPVSQESLSPTPNPPSPYVALKHSRTLSHLCVKATVASSAIKMSWQPLDSTYGSRTLHSSRYQQKRWCALMRTAWGLSRAQKCPLSHVKQESSAHWTGHNSAVRGRRLSVPWHCLIQHTYASTHVHARIRPKIPPDKSIHPTVQPAYVHLDEEINKSSTGNLLRFGLVRFSCASLGVSSGNGLAGRRSKTKTVDSAMVVDRSEAAWWPVPPKCQLNLSELEKMLGAGIICKWTFEGWDTWIRKIRVEWSHYRCNVPTARTGQTAAEIYSSSFLLDNKSSIF